MITGNKSTGKVHVGGVPLEIGDSQKIYDHSQEFAWGYVGSGPAQLALALLYYFTHDKDWSREHHQEFKFAVIAGLHGNFQIRNRAVTAWIRGMGGSPLK